MVPCSPKGLHYRFDQGEHIMATLPIDGSKITLIATGKYRPVRQYAELADGQRRMVPDSHETNDAGVPLWAIDVLLDDDDASRAEAISVKVPSLAEPVVPSWQPITFTGLVCRPYVLNGSRQVGLAMRAEGIEVSASTPARSAAKSAAEWGRQDLRMDQRPESRRGRARRRRVTSEK